jgi:protein O-GlcNAc transferase
MFQVMPNYRPPPPAPRFLPLWQQAARLQAAGDLDGALGVLQTLTRKDKKNPDAWVLLGVVQERRGELDAGAKAYRQALRLAPRYAPVYGNLAGLRYRQGDPAEAIRLLQQALALDPELPGQRLRLGQYLLEAGQAAAAEPHLRQALSSAGAAGHTLLALALQRQDRLEEAEAQHRQACAAPGAGPAAWLNLGQVLLDRQAYEEALAALERARQLAPAAPEIALQRAKALAGLRRLDAAEALLQETARRHPAALQGLFDARAMGTQFPDQVPNRTSARLLFAELWAKALEVCDWRDYAANLAQIRADALAERGQGGELPALRPFRSLQLPLAAEFQLALARDFSARIDARLAAARAALTPAPALAPEPLLRIGYLSPDFRKCVVGLLFRELFAGHDRARFRIHGYSLAPDDGSPEHGAIRAGCNAFTYLHELDSRQAAQRIRQDGLHILVDMAGYVRDARPEILALRPAPIQLSYGGYPGTTGAPWIDYRILGDTSLPRTAADQYSEPLVWLPGSHHLVSTLTAAASTPTRADCGLPATARVFACFQGNVKIEPEIFAVWMRILQRVPESVLWLLRNRPAGAANLRQAAAAVGVDPDRLVFADLVEIPEHLARLPLADLFLDTRVYSGFATVAMTLWAGVPILAFGDGGTEVARLGASALLACGLGDTLAADLADYEERAVALATQPDQLARLRTRTAALRETAPLFRPASVIRYLEQAYQGIWRRHAAGLPPAPIQLTPAGTTPASG